MREYLKFYIGGAWVDPAAQTPWTVIDPATEQTAGVINLGGEADVDRAVRAARAAFPAFSRTSTAERIALLERVILGMEGRRAELARAMSEEMGVPGWLAGDGVVASAVTQTKVAIETLKTFAFEKLSGATLVRSEPIGVCALITPWNWPAGAVMTKLAPALAVGCTVVLKPSEFAPFSAQILAEILHEAQTPPGVFNLVQGDGPCAGAALSGHADVDMVTFTGSTRAGIEVARNAALTVKRVHQELGGKSPNIILPSANLEVAVPAGLRAAMINSGQACVAPTRMLVPTELAQDVEAIAVEASSALSVGPPDSGAYLGPVVNARQWASVQDLIQSGIKEGARLLFGGPGRPAGLERGYYVRPTVFVDTAPDMRIVREEIFGPVLVIQEYSNVDQALRMANDTSYGLGAYLQGEDLEELREIAARIPAGQVYLNGTGMQLSDPNAPFGGFKRSGNGRERGAHGFEAYLELKSILGYAPA